MKPNSKPTAPGSVPVKTGYTFKGWFTAKSGGSLYSTVTITSSTTFYAQFEANKYAVTWDLGTGQSETTEQTYGEKLVLPTEPTRKNAEFLGWFTSATGGAEVDYVCVILNIYICTNFRRKDDVYCLLVRCGTFGLCRCV